MPEIPADASLRLTTARLLLEPYRIDFAAEAYEIFRDPLLYAKVSLRPPQNFAEFQARAVRWSRRVTLEADRLSFNWLVRRRDNGRAIGQAQAFVLAGGAALLGWLVRREEQKQGFAFEQTAAVLVFLQTAYGVREVRAEIHPSNVASIAIARKLGMKDGPPLEPGELCFYWRSGET